MATKIKLTRIGKMRNPFYRVIVADSRAKRDGRSIETIGRYNPKADPSIIEIDSDRAQYWLGVGAQPTEAVAALLRVTGDWQKFKGEPAPAPMLMAEPKADKHSAFAAAAAVAAGITADDKGAATTPKKKAAPKAAKVDSVEEAPAAEAADTEAATSAPAAEATEAVEVAQTAEAATDESAS